MPFAPAAPIVQITQYSESLAGRGEGTLNSVTCAYSEGIALREGMMPWNVRRCDDLSRRRLSKEGGLAGWIEEI